MKRENDLIVSNDEGNGNCLVDISSDPNTLVEFKNEHSANLFVDIQKEIKVDGGKDLANVGIIKIRRVDDTTFMKESLLEVLKSKFVFVERPEGLIDGIWEYMRSGVLVLWIDCLRHIEPKKNYSNKVLLPDA
ncbi:hypothetical protein Tco_0474077 [Tanacetum coccineum]